MTAVLVPDIGDATDVTVIEIHVKPGDTIAVDDPVVTLESDKATMDVPSTVAGVVRTVAIEAGDVVAEGRLLLEVDEPDGASAEQAVPAASAGAPVDAPPPPPPAPTVAPPIATLAAASPAGAAPAGAAPAGGPEPPGGAEEVRVPDIGDASEVTVIEIHVKPGDTIAVEDPVVTLESDKATMDVPSSAAGTVATVLVAVGDVVAEGTALIAVTAAGAAQGTEAATPGPSAASVAEPAPAEPAPAESAPAEPAPAASDGDGVHASPLARRLARELGVDLTGVTGTARNGRIGRDDVLAAADAATRPAQAAAAGAAPTPASAADGRATPSAPAAGAGLLAGLPPWPSIDFAKYGEIEVVPLSRIKKIVGANLHRNWVQIPHVTHHDEADVTDLEAFRVRTNEEHAKEGVKLTMVALLLRASVAALKQHPSFNASLVGDDLVLKRYFHLGVAVDTPNGLVVPVVRDVDRKGLLELAAELADVSARAREGKLAPGDMQGATFTISSLGGIGGTGFTPIVNAPEVAILGVTRTAMRPVWDGAAFIPRLMLPLSLSYDHRVIDGAAAARFTRSLAAALEDLRRTLL